MFFLVLIKEFGSQIEISVSQKEGSHDIWGYKLVYPAWWKQCKSREQGANFFLDFDLRTYLYESSLDIV